MCAARHGYCNSAAVPASPALEQPIVGIRTRWPTHAVRALTQAALPPPAPPQLTFASPVPVGQPLTMISQVKRVGAAASPCPPVPAPYPVPITRAAVVR